MGKIEEKKKEKGKVKTKVKVSWPLKSHELMDQAMTSMVLP